MSGWVASGRRLTRAAVVPLAAVVSLAATATLAACSSDAGGWTDDGKQTGYVSADHTVTQWAPDDRGDAVALSGTDFSGAAVDVADWRGDVVVLNTWYASCPPCRAEAPDLVSVAGEYADKGVHVLGINTRDDAGAAQAFERTFAVTYPSIEGRDGTAVAALQGVVAVQAVPTTVVLDRTGRVAARILGALDAPTLRGLLDDALAEPA